MQFDDIGDVVLSNVGRYGDDNAGTLILLGHNINNAIKALKRDLKMEAIEVLEEITTTDRSVSLDPAYTPVATDIFDIHRIRYKHPDDEYPLDRVYQHNLKQRVDNLSQTGRPDVYLVRGNTGNIINIECYAITKNAGETIKLYYIPILDDLSGVLENIITIRYPTEVIEIATAYSQRNIERKDISSASIVRLIDKLAVDINTREQSLSDYNYNQLPHATLIAKRKNRLTK